MNFKIWCKMSSKLIPDTDEEMLRHLYACLGDHDKSYDSMRQKYIYRDSIFPIEFNDNMTELLNCGGIYIHGRDKCFRPIVIINIQ